MKDQDVKLSMQNAGNELKRRFPGRAWSLFVWPAEIGQRAHYVSNAGRAKTIESMQELIKAGVPGLPDDDLSRS